MTAYNSIIIRSRCPSCGKQSEIKCQTHIASSFDGDESGRFCNRIYHIGEKLAWWSKGSKKYDEWRIKGKKDFDNSTIDFECCYASCLSCNAQLYVILEFKDATPTKVVGVGVELDWPQEYLK